ncbi:MAG: PLP-dependent aminotransferase family protein [Verrucomicrobia bacterium]|nr:PLP-dependent aminotransferase family protein [Verrucomicrobiota bacterium]
MDHSYQQLANNLQKQINARTYLPGDRLPSVRELAKDHGLSLETVLHALRILENNGLVDAKVRSGFYVREPKLQSVATPNKTATVFRAKDVTLSLLRHQAVTFGTSKNIVPLGLSLLSSEVLPTRRLAQTLSSVARRYPKETSNQAPVAGMESLRQQLAQRASNWGCFLSPDDVVITCGASEALHLALRAVSHRGDIVLVESPCYFGTLEIIESLGLRVIEIATDPREGVDLPELESALKRFNRIAACLLVTNASNPLGYTLTSRIKQNLVRLLSRFQVPLIEDDIFGELHRPETERPKVAKSFDEDGTVILVGSFSKTLAPGLRIGWMVPGKFRDRILQLKSATSLATPSLPQLAAAEFLKFGSFDAHLRRLRGFLADQIYRFSSAIAESFPPATRISRPSGGFLLWLELDADFDALTFAASALNRYRIAVVPGNLFSAGGERYQNCFRISCGHAFSPRFAEAIATLGKLACSREARTHDK